MSDLWTAIKSVVELGALGVLLALMVIVWLRTNRELKESMKERLFDEREHKRELLKQQTEHNQVMAGLVRQYDETLTVVSMVLERVNNRLEE